ncbi:MAG: HAMP domain-containing protein [Desulfomonile tiedjei]|nr:HAMP domain-containing protein [Desulfomonile tiedjei]
MALHTSTHTAAPEQPPGFSPAEHARRSSTFEPGNRLVLIFCILALIAVAANVTLLLDVSSELPNATIIGSQGPPATTGKAANAAFHERFRNLLTLVLAVTVMCFGCIIYLFVSRVVKPLKAVTDATREMAKGNLGVTAPVDHNGELGELGHVINDLVVNFQEVLLLTGTAVGNSSSVVERIERALEREGLADANDLGEQVTALRKDLDMLRSVVRDFQFYHTRFDGTKVVHGLPGPENRTRKSSDASSE